MQSGGLEHLVINLVDGEEDSESSSSSSDEDD